ncbi:fibrobacter succinogenes major paralogous domain-containing protein [Flavobacterium ajazii]|uniref:fibrobacter succinogenes major paralogous domain-containing protein n=1 Tax=Flavobacterium ajazii TaxID=2692318 RepID=UPI0013D1442C|nr:fibrobacter succinogenes major paralogous domain-containing protein [Flavobacterium ajazii]
MKQLNIYKIVFFLFFISLFSCKNAETAEDIDGNVYHTIRIGRQTWMVENLKVTRFNNGDSIKKFESNSDWKQANQAGYSFYNNDVTIVKDYGFLYNYKCLQDARGIAPEGWRIPTEEDLRELESFVNSNSIGIFLKEKGNSHWLPSNVVGNNATGFNALPGGYRDEEGNFYMLRSNGYYWTTNGSFEFYNWSDRMFQAFADTRRDSVFKRYGFSIKCIKEE